MTHKRSSPPDSPRCRFTFADGRRCASPATTSPDGLCYHHAHAPHRRFRRSDLIRELESISSSPIDNANIRLMLECEHLSRREPLHKPRGSEWNFVVSILNSDDDEDEDEIPDDKLSPSSAHR